MIRVTDAIVLDDRDVKERFVRASGPGGQNVNKVATAVQLRFDVRGSKMPEDVKARLIHVAGRRVTSEGILLIEAKRFRTQEQNREDAMQRFIDLIRKSLAKPKPRKKTKPTKASKEARIKAKKIRGEIKRIRQNKSFE